MDLPKYVSVEVSNSYAESVLRTKAKPFVFPLSEEDNNDIKTLEAKFDQEENISGLAAPQIGISKRAIIFAVVDDQNIKKWRQDLTETMPKTIWLNPSCIAISEETREDYEGCFSVKNAAARVKRYKKISYEAHDFEGNVIKGTAEGFLARVIQHEIDHLNGKLFIDHVNPQEIFTIEEYREWRKKAMEDEPALSTTVEKI